MTVRDTTPTDRPLADRAIAFAVGIVALVVYLVTLCPTIFADDCGEIATAVATGGVMHPPGYPLYCLLGGLFVKFVPWGEPAHRLGLLSSVSAAASVAVLYLLCRKLGANRVWAAGSAFAFAFSYTLWQQATKVETYALNALFVASLLYLSLRYRESGKRSHFYWLSLVGGLALTNHLTIVWLIPAVLMLTIPTLFASERRGGAWKSLGIATLIVAAAVSLYGYEIIAARSHLGGQVWGDPSNLHRLWLHVTGARYHSLFRLPTAEEFFQRDIVFAPTWLWRNLGPMLIVAALGFGALWRRRATRPVANALGLAVASYLLCNSLYQILNIFEYYTSAVLVLAALASVGATCTYDLFAYRSRGGERTLALSSALLASLACIAPVMNNWAACDRSGADYYKVLAENTLATVPINAVIVADGDNHLFPLWYVQEVLGERCDVTILPRNEFEGWDKPLGRELTAWSAERVEREHPQTHIAAYLDRAANDPSYAAREGALWDIVADSRQARRAVYFTGTEDGDLTPPTNGIQQLKQIPGATLIEEGLLHRVIDVDKVPTAQTSLVAELAREPLIRYEYAPPALFTNEPDGAITNNVYAIHLTTLAQLQIAVKDYNGAWQHVYRAVTLDPKSARAQDTYAMACMMTGRPDDAVDAWRTAVALDPANPGYRQNLAAALQQTANSPRQGG